MGESGGRVIMRKVIAEFREIAGMSSLDMLEYEIDAALDAKDARIKELESQVATFHQSNIDRIRKAAEGGTIEFADTKIVDYLAMEVSELFPSLGVTDAFISDESRVSDFPLEVLPDKYVWQIAIDRLREKSSHGQHALDEVLREAVWAMEELDVYLSHDHEASFADRLHAQAFLDSQIVRGYRARQEQG